jgi:hypothetical protein
MNIDIQLIDRQIIKINTNKERNVSFISKICLYDFFSMNEINICKIIRKIPYYYCEYNVIEESNFIKIGEISEKIIQKLQISYNKKDNKEDNKDNKKEQKYLLLRYKDEKLSIFTDFLFSFYTPKIFIFHILDAYSLLLKKFIQLNKNNICFFDLSSENIFFREKNKPLLQNFRKSLLINSLDETYISRIITKITDYTCKPIEIYVLFYLIIQKEETLSYTYIETIVSFFVDNMSVLTLFSEKYKQHYKQLCIDFLKKYINRPKSEIIHDILTYSDTWDNYSLSIIYLHVIGTIIKVFSLKDNFMNQFLTLLIKNIHPNPLKREKLEETQQNYENIFNSAKWDFISELSCNKMKKLHELL